MPTPPKLRIGEDAVRYEPIFGGEIFFFDQIAVDDLKIVVRNVRESRAPIAIAERPDAGNVCFQAAIHFDKTIFIGFNAGFFETEIFVVCLERRAAAIKR